MMMVRHRAASEPVIYLFQVIDSLCGFDSDFKETQDPSDDVDNAVRNLSSSVDVTDMSTGILKHEGFDELGSDTLGELWGGIKAVFPREAIELLEGQVKNLCTRNGNEQFHYKFLI